MIDLTEFESRAVPLHALGVVVSQNGTQLARKLWDDTCRRNVYSASKSFTSMAVGIAQKEDLLSIDEKLTDAFKDDLPEIVSDNLKAATVRDLLTMCLGQEKSFLMAANARTMKTATGCALRFVSRSCTRRAKNSCTTTSARTLPAFSCSAARAATLSIT